VELAELPGIGLLSLFENSAAAILVDAVRTGAPPGTLHRITKDQLAAFEAGSGSAHGWGVAETLSIGGQLMPDALPRRLVLIGIEAGQLVLGENLSPQVKSALPEAADFIERVVLEELAHS
jgi:hydrogenase maturation protease